MSDADRLRAAVIKALDAWDDAHEKYLPGIIAAAIVEEFGLTRSLVASIYRGYEADYCHAGDWGDRAIDIGSACEEVFPLLKAILDVAEADDD